MIVVSEEQQNDSVPLRDLMAYLLRQRRPKIEVLMRPYCPVHDVPMKAGKTPRGLTHFYCQHVDEDGIRCRETWQTRKRVV